MNFMSSAAIWKHEPTSTVLFAVTLDNNSVGLYTLHKGVALSFSHSVDAKV